MDWPRLLAYITGTVDQELLLRNEYLRTENRILKAQIKGRLLLSDAERATLAEIGHRLGRKALEGHLPPFQKETTARRRECDSLFSKPDYQRNSGLNFSLIMIESQVLPQPSRLLPMARIRCQLSQW